MADPDADKRADDQKNDAEGEPADGGRGVVDAEFEDTADDQRAEPAGPGSPGAENAGETDAAAKPASPAPESRRLSPGLVLFVIFMTISLCAFAVWRVQALWTSSADDAAPLEETSAPPASGEATDASRNEPAANGPSRTGAGPEKISNDMSAPAKTAGGAGAIESDNNSKTLPPPPAAGSANDELQDAAKRASRAFQEEDGDVGEGDPPPPETRIKFESETDESDDMSSSNGGDAQTADNSGASSSADVDAELLAETKKLSAALNEERQRTAVQKRQIEALRADVARVIDVSETRAEEQTSDLDARLRRLENGSSAERLNQAAATLALVALSRQVESGAPYRDQLAAFQRIAPQMRAADQLQSGAETGVATDRALDAGFDSAARAALTAAARENAEGPAGRFLARLQAIVAARPAQPKPGDAPGDVISRAESALDHARLGAAVAELEQLEGGAADAIAPWLDEARARVAADNALEALNTALLNTYEN